MAVTNYKLSAMGSVTQLKPRELQVHSDNSRLDILRFYYINVNLESQTATNSFVIATLYDKDGKVISPRSCTNRTGKYYSALSGALRNGSD